MGHIKHITEVIIHTVANTYHLTIGYAFHHVFWVEIFNPCKRVCHFSFHMPVSLQGVEMKGRNTYCIQHNIIVYAF